MKRKISLTTQYIIIVCALLLTFSVAIGVALMLQSGSSMKKMIRKHMLSVSDTAADLLDGDALAAYTEADAGSELYDKTIETLTKIKNSQHDDDIKYIYLVRREGDRFVFIIDPDPIRPAEYGREVVHTPAQDVAWAGTGAVDEDRYEDDWGCYYTAWSPVKDSSDNVVCMVGVDFEAEWYDRQMAVHTIIVIITGCLSLGIGAAIMILLTGQLRRRFQMINTEASVLAKDVERLSEEIIRHSTSEELPGEGETAAADREQTEAEPDKSAAPGRRSELAEETSDMIGELSAKLRTMRETLKEYLDYVNKQAYTDSMTNTANKRAYLDRIKELNREIAEGTADFSVAVFDINGLKNTNDNYGHESGDRIIIDAAMLIHRVFKNDQVYRIGGDEFIAVLDKTSAEDLRESFARLDALVECFNRNDKHYQMTLSFSKGGATYRPGKDPDFKEVFKRADHAMYRDKGNYYRVVGDRRHQYNDIED